MLCLEITQGLAKYMYVWVPVYLKQTSLPAALDLSLECFTFQISSQLSELKQFHTAKGISTHTEMHMSTLCSFWLR